MADALVMDTGAVERMLSGLEQRVDRVPGAVADVARGAHVTGVPRDTGRLASSLRVRETDDGAEIVSDVEYAQFVFGGTRYMQARPPTIDVDARTLSQRLAREVF